MSVLKVFLPSILLVLSICADAQEKLVLIGGGPNRPEAALQQFANWAEQKNILIIAWASEIPKETAEDVATDIRPHFSGKIEFALHPPKDQPTQLEFSKQLSRASGVFFTGGNQMRIMRALTEASGAELETLLNNAYRKGVVFGGTSAGTAVMSFSMITGGTDKDVQTSRGLGFLATTAAPYLVDQHFSQRNRKARLLQAMRQTKTEHGLGVDEDTAVVIENRTQLKVLGAHRVRIFFQPNDANFTEQILHTGDSFDLTAQ